MKRKYICYVVVLILIVVAFVGVFLVQEKRIKELHTVLVEKDKRIEQYKIESEELSVQNNNESLEMNKEIIAQWTTDTNDVLYKLFYGEWVITSVIEGRTFNEEIVDDFIGKVIEYSSDSIRVDGVEVLIAPAYAYGIVPMDKYSQFVQGYSPKGSILNLQNDYFVYISVETWTKGFAVEDYVYKHFFIVDDNTLILDAYDAFFVMERMNYMDGYYDGIETFQDYSW